MKILFNKWLFIGLSVFFLTVPDSFAQQISGDKKVCYYSETVYSVSDLPKGWTGGRWSTNNGSVLDDEDEIVTTTKISWGMTGTATINFYYNDASGVGQLVTFTEIQIIGPTAILYVDEDPGLTVCQGTPVTLTASVSGSPYSTYSYSWENGKAGESVTEYPGVGYHRYSVTATDDHCSQYTYTQEVYITVNPNPAITTTIHGTTPLCPGSAYVTLIASASNGATSFTWSPTTALGVSAATSTTSSVVASPDVTTTYAARGTNSYGCSVTNYITVPVYPVVAVDASVKVSGSVEEHGFMCRGGSVNLAASNATSYFWDNMSSLTLNTSNGSSVTARPSASTTYTVTGVINGCSTTTQRTVVVGLPPNTPTIAGPDLLCINPPTQTYSVPIGNTYDVNDVPVYTWSVSPVGFATFVGSNIGSTCTIDFNNYFTGTGQLKLTVTNRCGTTDGFLSVNIAAGVPATPVVSGPTSVCKGTSSTYSIGGPNAYTTWEVSPVSAVSSSSTSPMGLHTVNWNPSFTGTASVRVRVRNGCGYSAWSYPLSISIPNNRIFQGPTPIPQISGDNFAFAKGDYNRDGIMDIYAIKKYNGGTASTELHVLNGANNYNSYLLQVPTAWPQTDNTFEFQVGDYNRDGIPDLYIIRKQPVHTHNTEVHVLNGATNYQSFLLQAVTIAPKTDSNSGFCLGDFNLDGVLDLYHIAKYGTVSGRVEVNVLDGTTNFSSSLLRATTIMNATADNLKFLLNTHGRVCKPDLVIININPLSNAPSPVNILSGANNYGTYQKQTSLVLDGSYEKTDFLIADRSGNITSGYQDLFLIKKTQTTTAYTIVEVLDGRCFFGNCGSSGKIALDGFEENDDVEKEGIFSSSNNSLIYPNPISEGRVSFKEKAVVFQLYDAKGTLVKTGTDVDGFSVDGLQRGIYFIKIDGRSEKLIIE